MDSETEDTYERIDENHVRARMPDGIPNIDESAIFSISPTFEDMEISDSGAKIATNSMIDEGQIGCSVCELLRPVELFDTVMENIAVCEICLDKCPNCGTVNSIQSTDSSVGCGKCELEVNL